VGETLSERHRDETEAVVGRQLDAVARLADARAILGGLVIAYEPVWAIGTGLNAGRAEIEEMHAHIRNRLRLTRGEAWAGVRVLYGGSVKPDNAGDILCAEGVDGVLVGGASLKAADFSSIARA